MVVVQIGVNVANDACFKFLKENKHHIEAIYLVEPLPKCIEIIKQAYKDFKNVTIHNIAIAINNDKSKLNFYHPMNDHKSGHASTSYEHLIAHGHKNIEITSIDCITLENFFVQNNINFCDRLYIDTEGLDCSILLDFNYNKYNIKYIEFEKIHSDGAFKTGDNYYKCIKRFREFGYTVRDSGQFNCIAEKK